MADLNFDYALSLAETLKTIPGFFTSASIIQATAQDLQRWCKGIVTEDELWSPEQQAWWLVTELREHWDKWNGSAAMRQIFFRKFEPQKLGAEFQPVPSTKDLQQQYGPPNQEWSRDIIRAATGNKNQDFKNQLTDMRQQAIRDSLYYIEGPGRNEIAGSTKEKRESQQFWQNAMGHHLREHPEEVASIREQIATGQIGPVPPPPDKPSDERKQVRTVTAADVEEARRRLKGRDDPESPSSPPPV